MSEYIKLSTQEYPLFEGDIRLEYPEISEEQTGENFPCPETYALVKFVNPPLFNWRTHKLFADKPLETSDGWIKVWKVLPLSEEELIIQKEFLEKNYPDLVEEPNNSTI